MTKVFTLATMDDDLTQKWLQHLRDFDMGHPGCHFEVAVEPEEGVDLLDAVNRLRVDPALTFTAIFGRKRKP